MSKVLLPLLVAAMMGAAAVFEKLSLREGSPLNVFTLRTAIMLAVLLALLIGTGSYRDYATYQGRTYLWILIPAFLAIGFLLLYFHALQGDLASRVMPLVATAPVFTVLYSILFLGEPLSWKRIGGVILIVLGILFVK